MLHRYPTAHAMLSCLGGPAEGVCACDGASGRDYVAAIACHAAAARAVLVIARGAEYAATAHFLRTWLCLWKRLML